MNVPHTGQLEARIKVQLCQFNGNSWSTPVLTPALSSKERVNRPPSHSK